MNKFIEMLKRNWIGGVIINLVLIIPAIYSKTFEGIITPFIQPVIDFIKNIIISLGVSNVCHGIICLSDAQLITIVIMLALLFIFGAYIQSKLRK